MFDTQVWIFVRTYTPAACLGAMAFLIYAASSTQVSGFFARGLDTATQVASVAARDSFIPTTSASSTTATTSAIATPQRPSVQPESVQEPPIEIPVQRLPRMPLIPMSTTAIPVLPGQGAQAASQPPAQPAPTPESLPVPAPVPVAKGTILFSDSFSQYADGVITNEYAHWNPKSADAKKSSDWELTAGTIFARNGVAWSGVPDSGIPPNPTSSNANNSAILRLTTKRADFGDVSVSFDLKVLNLTATKPTPAVDWDGVHVFLRYQSQYHLYYASANRRDNTVIIKKKIPGGPSNNGTYYNLSQGGVKYTLPFNTWQRVEARVENLSDGSVSIELYADGKLLTQAIDNGTVGGAPIRTGGQVGIRGDNANLEFKNFVVTTL